MCVAIQVHMGDGGGDDDHPPSLAPKNTFPPLEPKIRDLRKISDQKRWEMFSPVEIWFVPPFPTSTSPL